MLKSAALALLVLLAGCSKDDGSNDPYVIENTEIYSEPPAPYYDETDNPE